VALCPGGFRGFRGKSEKFKSVTADAAVSQKSKNLKISRGNNYFTGYRKNIFIG
jgi:hypothetical protein